MLFKSCEEIEQKYNSFSSVWFEKVHSSIKCHLNVCQLHAYIVCINYYFFFLNKLNGSISVNCIFTCSKQFSMHAKLIFVINDYYRNELIKYMYIPIGCCTFNLNFSEIIMIFAKQLDNQFLYSSAQNRTRRQRTANRWFFFYAFMN